MEEGSWPPLLLTPNCPRKGGAGRGEPYLMQPLFCWKQVKTPTPSLSGEEKYAFVRLDVTKDQPARGPSWISSWDFTEKNKLI